MCHTPEVRGYGDKKPGGLASEPANVARPEFWWAGKAAGLGNPPHRRTAWGKIVVGE
ncbi:hypothetical protein GO755_20465 [Spirosoma sp. HMF4905]|uniref:Uncharacterized protein n=1 Tax=Spirosoma arboris TaxID=2682092 RepID=A0A7K1SF48_9BACT|nr:hypothetical protein [Spirosoma arboris]MVM32432.1 hypothetical protein [Spirosoma arboris]